jgi:hypothetical protein
MSKLECKTPFRASGPTDGVRTVVAGADVPLLAPADHDASGSPSPVSVVNIFNNQLFPSGTSTGALVVPAATSPTSPGAASVSVVANVTVRSRVLVSLSAGAHYDVASTPNLAYSIVRTPCGSETPARFGLTNGPQSLELSTVSITGDESSVYQVHVVDKDAPVGLWRYTLTFLNSDTSAAAEVDVVNFSLTAKPDSTNLFVKQRFLKAGSTTPLFTLSPSATLPIPCASTRDEIGFL